MSRPPRNIVVLGSTGSIGSSTLEVAAASEGRLRVIGLSANRSCQRLLEQARRVRPHWVAVTDEQSGRQFDWSELPKDTQLLLGTGGHGADGGARRGRRRGRLDRGQCRLGRRLGGGPGRKNAGSGQQGNAGDGRAAGHAARRPSAARRSCRWTASTARCSSRCRRAGGTS